jgi:hypothetical protein
MHASKMPRCILESFAGSHVALIDSAGLNQLGVGIYPKTGLVMIADAAPRKRSDAGFRSTAASPFIAALVPSAHLSARHGRVQ